MTGRRLALLIAALFVAWGCTTAQRIIRPDGSSEYLIACGAGTGWNVCYDRANQVCSTGYETLSRDDGFNRKELRILCSRRAHGAAPSGIAAASPASSEPAPVLGPAPTPAGGVVESRIDGEFKGWDGETLFKLQNGQIWQQSSYAYTYHYAYSPGVLIYPSGGGYKMRVDGVDKVISVRRLK